MKLALLLLAAGIIGCQRTDKEPRTESPADSVPNAVVATPDAPFVPADPIAAELPARMRAALEKFAPGFERFALADYSPELFTNGPSERPPYKATGDFNGDGIEDLGIFGRDRTRELVLALVSAPDSSYKVFALKEWPRPPLYNHNINISLASVKPGKVDVDYPEMVDSLRPSELPHGAVSVAYGGVIEVFYWAGSGFKEYRTAED